MARGRPFPGRRGDDAGLAFGGPRYGGIPADPPEYPGRGGPEGHGIGPEAPFRPVPVCGGRLHRQAAADRGTADDLPALHGGEDDGTPGGGGGDEGPGDRNRIGISVRGPGLHGARRLVGGTHRSPGEAGTKTPFRPGVRREGLSRRRAPGFCGGRALRPRHRHGGLGARRAGVGGPAGAGRAPGRTAERDDGRTEAPRAP